MFLSIDVCKCGTFSSAFPLSRKHNQLIINGESTIDNLRVESIELSDITIQSMNSEQQWDENTLFLANFEDTLDASKFNFNMPITHFRIKRRKTSELLYKLLTELVYTAGANYYIDYTAGSNTEYEYALYPVSNGMEGKPILAIGMGDFVGWQLTDGTTTYVFDLEVESDNVQTILDYKKYENYTEFPVFSFSSRQYDEGSLTTIPYQFNGNKIEFTFENLQQIKAFINNKQPKILKNSKGAVWKVITYDYSEKYMENFEEEPVRISFKWTQVGVG